MRILITGGAGFLGSEIVNKISNIKNVKLTVIDDLSRGYRQRLKKNIKKINFIKSDVCKLNNLRLPKFDWIIHSSAIAPLPDNQSNHYNSITSNVAQCGSVIDFCIRSGTKNLIFFSSSAIYEKEVKKPFSENITKQPILMYSTSKYLAEKYFDSVATSYKINIVSLRLANIYGRNQDYFRKQMPFLGYLIKNTLAGKKMTLYAKGDYKRDYLFIDDLVNLILKILKYKKLNYKHYVFNVGSGNAYSVLDFLKIIKNITGIKPKVSWGNKSNYWKKYKNLYFSKIKFNKKLIREEVEKKVFLNSDKAKKFFKWSPKTSIVVGLKECINYAKKIFN
tara:strand:- start:309 stop:1313 length:1005 start_codon:yes stop_codon:yes gene_type:complete